MVCSIRNHICQLLVCVNVEVVRQTLTPAKFAKRSNCIKGLWLSRKVFKKQILHAQDGDDVIR